MIPPLVRYSIADLAQKINAKIVGDSEALITCVSSLRAAKPGDLTFLAHAKYRRFLKNTKASAVLLTEADAADCPTTALIVDHPELAFARLARLFDIYPLPSTGIHPSAVISESAVIHASASIGPQCVIGNNVIVGKNTVLSAGTIVQDNTIIGDDCLLHSRVTLCHSVQIGHRVILHSGVVIGADGFGLVQHQGAWEKMPQLGSVVIGNDVEIGANTCIDRGALENTIIENGVKIDNLVQIAHNVMIGEHTVIAGCSSVAGSVQIGKRCMIAGAVSIAGHLTICDQVILTGCAMVTGSIDQPGVYSSGTGLLPNTAWRKMVVRLRQLDDWFRQTKK